MNKLKALVTGVGGPLGVSVLKTLRLSRVPCEITGSDVDSFSVGFHMADKVCILPDARIEDPQVYLEKLIEVCSEQGIKVIFTGSDAELRLLAANKELVERKTGALVMVNKSEIVETASDKWKTVEFLRSHGIPVPDSVLPGDWQEINDFINRHGFPLIVKPRFSSGSKGLFTVNNRDELKAALTFVKNAIIQEYLNPPDQEYTVGAFMHDTGQYLGSIIFHRWLGAGLTYKAVVSKNPEIDRVVGKATVALGAIGPVNVQLRLTEKGPVIFEINPRLSSSSVMRAHFGFNEAEMAIRRFVLGEKISLPQIKEGTALRFWEELYV